jgi:hypothetical protein
MARDEFSEAVKLQLAKRVGFKCTVCRCETTGPHSEPGRSVSIGMAAHITAASPGGPRYDSTLAPEQRSAIANGIWTCENHGKLVDTDEKRFTTEELCQLKESAEREQASSLLAARDVRDNRERARRESFESSRADVTLDGVTRHFVWDGALTTLPDWPARSLPGTWCDALDQNMQNLAAEPQRLALSWCTEDRPQFRFIYETDSELTWKRQLRGDPQRNAGHRFCLFAVAAAPAPPTTS